MEFILYGGEGGALVEGVENFKYLGRPLDQTDDNWTTIRQNIKQERTVWESLGKLLIREGKYTRVEAMFYRKVAQAVLFFDLETWVILEVTERKVEGTYTDFMRHITEMRLRWKAGGRWENPRAEVVLGAAGTQSEMNYTEKLQGKVAHWVTLRPIFEVCLGEEGYEEGVHRREKMVASRGGGNID